MLNPGYKYYKQQQKEQLFQPVLVKSVYYNLYSGQHAALHMLQLK